MHFILLVYKYEYIMNKSSYFIDLGDILCYFTMCQNRFSYFHVI